MMLFHRTAHAPAIVAGGFLDGRDDRPGSSGAWLSTALSGCGDGAEDDAVVIVKLPMGAIRQYEQLQVGQTYRTFLVPADVANEYKEGRVIARTSCMRVGGVPAEVAYQPPVAADDALIRDVGERVLEAVRAHLQTQPLDQWPRWMTTATCAKYIDRPVRGVEALVFKGRIPFVKQGGLIYFDRFVIDKWMAGRRNRPHARATRPWHMT